MKLFFNIYLRFTHFLIQSGCLKYFGVRKLRLDAWSECVWKEIPGETVSAAHVLFHAASVGELEILMPLIEGFAAKKIPMVVTVFSDSAFPQVARLTQIATYAGPSPMESDWSAFFQKFQIAKVIVSKYEAWPALWIECSVRNLPLILIHAKWRPSLALVKILIFIFGFPLPRLYLFAESVVQASRLKKRFKFAEVHSAMDPRWKRISDRSKSAALHPRVVFWKKRYADEILKPFPYGMVGSAWFEDLKVLLPAFREAKGTLWVIPHSLETKNIKRMQELLEVEIPGRYILVNEMGFLLELYSLAQWVWVGGGFGKGIHSTMEPAIYGVPLACGPKNVDQFFETQMLCDSQQLTVCKNTKESLLWLESQSNRSLLNVLNDQVLSHFSQLIEHCIQIS